MKGIVYVRVDDRLIHGQIAAFWTNFLKATRIMVVNDEAANDDNTRAVLKMATPQGVALSVLEIQKAATNILAGNYANQRVLMIFKNPKDALSLYEAGVKFEMLNIANMSGAVGKKGITTSVFCNDEEISDIKKIGDYGVNVIWQLVPGKESTNIINSINNL